MKAVLICYSSSRCETHAQSMDDTGAVEKAWRLTFRTHLRKKPIAVAERSRARTVFDRSNTAIVGSNPT
jgi:hypothetical protein